MEDQGDVRRDIYPHTRIAGTAAENMELAKQKISEAKKEKDQSVSSREYNLSHEVYEGYREMISQAKQYIKDLYIQTGVEIKDGDFAEIHLTRSWSQGDQKGGQGDYIGAFHSAYVAAKGGADFLEDAVAVFHELYHSVGRYAGVALEGGESFSGQSGYRTITKEGVLKKEMGNVMEEGMATRYANKFALESNSEIMKQARRSYVRHVESNRELSQDERNEISGMSDQEKENYICLTRLRRRQKEPYTNAEKMIEVLIQGAARSGPDQSAGVSMESDLLRSRVLTKNRGSLMYKIDSVFGKDATRDIFRLRFDSPAKIESVVRRLEGQVYG